MSHAHAHVRYITGRTESDAFCVPNLVSPTCDMITSQQEVLKCQSLPSGLGICLDATVHGHTQTLSWLLKVAITINVDEASGESHLTPESIVHLDRSAFVGSDLVTSRVSNTVISDVTWSVRACVSGWVGGYHSCMYDAAFHSGRDGCMCVWPVR
jgi:hypothetical protein